MEEAVGGHWDLGGARAARGRWGQARERRRRWQREWLHYKRKRRRIRQWLEVASMEEEDSAAAAAAVLKWERRGIGLL
jgi:hypothetical protein